MLHSLQFLITQKLGQLSNKTHKGNKFQQGHPITTPYCELLAIKNHGKEERNRNTKKSNKNKS